ncbi:hypothetical protein [Brucella intermedia]|uniref:hypothetical protein n=1 Tax=Brucella intermedia TaxID=94625 RepID=UPI00235E64D9|nr:hypothetical protein [Brucella intermedia]
MAGIKRPKAHTATTTTTAAAAAASAVSKPRQGRTAERHELRTTASATTAYEIDRHNLQFALREQIAYHAIREQALARLSRFLTGLQVFLGTGAIASIAAIYPRVTVLLMVMSALAGVVLLVVDPAGAARDHRSLRSRFHNILADVDGSDGTAESLRPLKAKRERTAADAPPAYRCVQAIAFNAAVNATYPEDVAARHRYVIGFWRRIFANWFPMRVCKFEKEKPNL